jgi:DNA (cytosine-5)-methyltransferase 1
MGQIIDLFSGIGGFSLAGHWNGWRTVIFCEINKFAQTNLRKNFPGVHIHNDIKTLTREKIESAGWDPNELTAVCGGFPCQPASVAGKRAGQTDARWLWPHMFRIIAEVQPDWVIAENVPGLLSLPFPVSEVRLVDQKTAEWMEGSVFEDICQNLEEIGYEVQAFVIPSGAVGALHYRERVWILANSNRNGSSARTFQGVNGSDDAGRQKRKTESFQVGRNLPAVRTEQLYSDTDANSAGWKEPEVQHIRDQTRFNPGPFSTRRSLDWNPNRPEILRAGDGLSDGVDYWNGQSNAGN